MRLFRSVRLRGRWLADAELLPGDLAAARERWSTLTRTAAMVVLALTVLLCAAPFLEARRHARDTRTVIATSLALVGILAAARWLLYLAAAPFERSSLGGPASLLPTALLLAALVWLAIDSMGRRQVAAARDAARRHYVQLVAVVAYAVAGAAAATLLWMYERTLAGMASLEAQDLVRFSLHPFRPVRIGVLASLTLLHAAVVWGAAGVIRLPSTLWRTPRGRTQGLVDGTAAVVGTLVTTYAMSGVGVRRPPLGHFTLAGVVALLAAWSLSRPRGPVRRASQAARLGLLFLALVVPAVALYPSLQAFAVAFKEQNVVVEMALQVASQREDLQLRRLPHALESIDALSTLTEFVPRPDEDAAPTTDRAFIIWSPTEELARSRTTSAMNCRVPAVGWSAMLALDADRSHRISWRLVRRLGALRRRCHPLARRSATCCGRAGRSAPEGRRVVSSFAHNSTTALCPSCRDRILSGVAASG
ncbi:MAG: hypothetical protein U0Q11_19315 [Vicinamibacterales bacterium]